MNQREKEKPRERGLGRGLAELLGEDSWQERSTVEVLVPNKSVRQMPIEFLVPNPHQPRRNFSSDELRTLADSINQKGLLQPILIRPSKEHSKYFEIVAGERRWRAAQMSGLHEVPVFERNLSDSEALECALVENVQRSGLDPMEESKGYQQLMDKFGHTQESLAKILSKSRAQVANILRLQKLPDGIQEMLSHGRLSIGCARPLIGHPDAESLASKIISSGLNARQAEELVAGRRNKVKANGNNSSKALSKGKSADTRRLERNISSQLGLRVAIEQGSRESGRVVVCYKRIEQLEEVCARLVQAPSISKQGNDRHSKRR